MEHCSRTTLDHISVPWYSKSSTCVSRMQLFTTFRVQGPFAGPPDAPTDPFLRSRSKIAQEASLEINLWTPGINLFWFDKGETRPQRSHSNRSVRPHTHTHTRRLTHILGRVPCVSTSTLWFSLSLFPPLPSPITYSRDPCGSGRFSGRKRARRRRQTGAARDFPSRFLCEDVDAHQNIRVAIGDLVTERQHITWCTDEEGGGYITYHITYCIP